MFSPLTLNSQNFLRQINKIFVTLGYTIFRLLTLKVVFEADKIKS